MGWGLGVGAGSWRLLRCCGGRWWEGIEFVGFGAGAAVVAGLWLATDALEEGEDDAHLL